ncbi:MAG: rhomboid family intramembrane serine protease, partial [Armatimonadota bacterium]
MIPLSDENPTRSKPIVVYLLLIINVFVFAYDKITAHQVGPVMINGLWDFMLVPAALIQNQDLYIPYGPVRVLYQGLEPKWLTLFTSMFMHGSFMHIGGNMLYLWIFGNNIEDILGHFKFLIFYIFCGLIAAFAHILFNLNSAVPTVGASGAIAGVLGAYLILFPAARIKTLLFIGFFWTFMGVPAVILLGVWFFSQRLMEQNPPRLP